MLCFFVFYCDAWSCRCSCMGSTSVSSCRCCMFVSCEHPACILWEFSMLHNLQFVNTCRRCKRRPCGRAIIQSGLMNAL